MVPNCSEIIRLFVWFSKNPANYTISDNYYRKPTPSPHVTIKKLNLLWFELTPLPHFCTISLSLLFFCWESSLTEERSWWYEPIKNHHRPVLVCKIMCIQDLTENITTGLQMVSTWSQKCSRVIKGINRTNCEVGGAVSPNSLFCPGPTSTFWYNGFPYFVCPPCPSINLQFFRPHVPLFLFLPATDNLPYVNYC